MSQTKSDNPPDYQAMIAELRKRTAGRRSYDMMTIGELLSIIGEEEDPIGNSSLPIRKTSQTLVSDRTTTQDPVRTDTEKTQVLDSNNSPSTKSTSPTPSSSTATKEEWVEPDEEEAKTRAKKDSGSKDPNCTCDCHNKDKEESSGYDWTEGLIILLFAAVTPSVFVALWEHEHILEKALWKNPQVKILLQSQPPIAAIHLIKFLVRLLPVPKCLARRPKRYRFIVFCFSFFISECLAMACGACFAFIFRSKNY